MAIVFTYGGSVVTIAQDPAMGNISKERKWMNPSVRSGAGDLFVYDKNLVRDIVTLTWRFMHLTDLTNVLAFLDVVNGSANAFDYVDQDGTHNTVHYYGPDYRAWTPEELTDREFTMYLLVG